MVVPLNEPLKDESRTVYQKGDVVIRVDERYDAITICVGGCCAKLTATEWLDKAWPDRPGQAKGVK